MMRLIDADGVIKAIDRHTFDTADGLCLDEDITIILEEVPSAHPEMDEWCDTCKEYDTEKHCCPRWNRVIRDAVEEIKQQWIPCSERLPEDLEEVNVTWVNHDPEPYYNFLKDKPFTATAVYYKEKWYWYSSACADVLAEYGRNPNDGIDDGIEIIAWMPLPEPYKENNDA